MVRNEGLDTFVYENKTVGYLRCCLVIETGNEFVNVLCDDEELFYRTCHYGLPEEVYSACLYGFLVEFLDSCVQSLFRLSVSPDTLQAVRQS